MFDKIKQLMELKSKMDEIKKKLDAERIEASSNDGIIKIVMNGSQEVMEVTVAPEFSSQNNEKFAKQLKETISRAIKLSQQTAAKKMGEVTGLGLPGL